MTPVERRLREHVEKAELSGKPHQARDRSQACSGAWWYEDWNRIDIYCQQENGPVLSFRISRRDIEAWLKRRSAAHRKGKRHGK